MTSLLSNHALLIILGFTFFMGLILMILATGSTGHKMKCITNFGFYLALIAAFFFAVVFFIDVLPLALKMIR
ncbi:TPA: hypothetical protein ACG3N9_000801 [Legionella pneumophila]|nr:hypothetical protein [Legionella pneumophila]